jgi:endonuclease/exonuclease/phosphatase family metal-dependent hydrolase
VREIYDSHIAAGEDWVVVLGDLNEIPGNDPLTPLLRESSTLKDVAGHAGYNDGGRPGSHGNCGVGTKLDHIFLSPKLFDKVQAAGIERRGMWGGTTGKLWPHFAELTKAEEAASDHAAVWVDLNI